MKIHRQIGIGPVALHTQTLELFALNIDPTGGKFAAFLTEFNNRHVVLVAALGAVLLFDLPFNRQAMAVPSGDIAGVFAHHLLRAHNHIFQDFVERVADVQMPVRIRRAIVQGKGRAACFGPQLAVNVHFGPTVQPLGLALGQSGAHREIGAWQVQSLFIFGGVGAHMRRPFQQHVRNLGGAKHVSTLARQRYPQRAGDIIRICAQTIINALIDLQNLTNKRGPPASSEPKYARRRRRNLPEKRIHRSWRPTPRKVTFFAQATGQSSAHQCLGPPR